MSTNDNLPSLQHAGDVADSPGFVRVRRLLTAYRPRRFTLKLWDGTVVPPEDGKSPLFTLVVRHRRAATILERDPTSLALGEAYVDNLIDIEGNLEAAFPVFDHMLGNRSVATHSLGAVTRWFWRSSTRLRRNGGPNGRVPARLRGERSARRRTAAAVHYHYNLPVDFWRLWLDEHLQYTCGYFEEMTTDLAEAQARKLEYVCKKLGLVDGMRILDLGCGWGGLLSYAIRHFGALGKGVTLSRVQADYANDCLRRQGIADRGQVRLTDFRDITESEAFDRLAGLGIVEHVGESMLSEYFAQAWRALRPGGLFLNQGIARSESTTFDPTHSFIGHYVFPDAQLLPISTTLHAAECAGFEVRDVESLREHYVLTLRKWLSRLEANEGEVCRLTNVETFRTFRIYLAGSLYNFQRGRLNVYQILLSKPRSACCEMPLTRADWYASRTSTEAPHLKEG
jgi:cyclopropane-fatty-acyl-phospholipid synthase